MSRPYEAIMLIGFGAATSREEVRPFLSNVVNGRAIPQARLEEVVHHYEAIGGGSPYNAHTMRQAAALREWFVRAGIDAPVYVGMRNWTPYVRETLAEIAGRGARRVLGVVLAAHRCEASWERYLATVDAARAALGADAPAVEYLAPWHADPLFVQAVAARVRETYEHLGPVQSNHAHLLFTAHSIPTAMARRSRYVAELEESCRLVAAELAAPQWSIAYQSRSGDPREPWLEPSVEQSLRELGGGNVVVVPIGFLCDHVEVVYDLDVEVRAMAGQMKVRMERAPTVGDHPLFIRMLGEAIRRQFAAALR
jgi:ferrochelatase